MATIDQSAQPKKNSKLVQWKGHCMIHLVSSINFLYTYIQVIAYLPNFKYV